ncbi:MAG TPA: hypothetical protein VFY10_15500 [Dehalococcoidia bacterium]|nr:hypothetical protein [Dehalococcoidia bacterium]
MVRGIAFLTTAIVALLVLACGGSSGPAATATLRPTPVRTATPTPTGPQATIDPKAGPPGTEVTVSGSGWPANTTVDLQERISTAEYSTPFQTLTTDTQGGFSVQFRIEKTPDGGATLPVGLLDLVAKSDNTIVPLPYEVQTRRPISGNVPGS